jgi:hypothetical protein
MVTYCLAVISPRAVAIFVSSPLRKSGGVQNCFWKCVTSKDMTVPVDAVNMLMFVAAAGPELMR